MSDVFTIHSLPAAYGDAFWIEYGPENDSHRILVDAGTPDTFKRLGPLLNKFVALGKPAFELLVITHIDADHIGGVLPIVEDPKLARLFKDIWFNGREHLVVGGGGLQPFGAVQGERLTKALIENKLPWNVAFCGGPIVTGANGEPVMKPLDGNLNCTLLSPNPAKLAKLLPKWDTEIRKAGLDPNRKPRKVPAPAGLTAMGPLNVEALANTVTPEDSAEANGSSIALLLEYKGRKMLLGADAHPSVLLQALDHIEKKRYPVELFKLPHHASKANVTKQLLERVPAAAYIVSTNGKLFRHPDREAVARVILAPSLGRKKAILFNYSTEFTDLWAKHQTKHNFEVHYGNELGITAPIAV